MSICGLVLLGSDQLYMHNTEKQAELLNFRFHVSISELSASISAIYSI